MRPTSLFSGAVSFGSNENSLSQVGTFVRSNGASQFFLRRFEWFPFFIPEKEIHESLKTRFSIDFLLGFVFLVLLVVYDGLEVLSDLPDL
jgi:hypothetical protein